MGHGGKPLHGRRDRDGRGSGSSPGGVAQLGERLNGIQEVRGSIPLASMLESWESRVQGSGFRVRELDLDRAGIAQLGEHNLAKVGVAGSSPVSRSIS